MSFTATYSPDDNKLRLYASSRLDAELYASVKALGFRWAPKQELFFAPAWSPEREDFLIELAGELADEDTSLVDRAEERAERFEDYGEKRLADAEAARKAVDAIADNIPLGQPILIGHHSEKHARRDAARIENGMRRAIRMWDTSNYWKARAAGAISNAKYKELPAVRHRRIKGLESELRKVEKSRKEHAMWLRAWTAIGDETDLSIQTETAIRTANVCWLHLPRKEGDRKDFDGAPTAHCVLTNAYPNLYAPQTVEEIVEHAKKVYPRGIERCDRWVAHLGNRLAYERAMLDEQIGTGELGSGMGGRFDVQPGAKVLVRGEWLIVLRVNKAGGIVNSVTSAPPSGVTWARSWKYGIEKIQDYQPPAPEMAARVKKALKLPPICNYPGEGFREMTEAEWKGRKGWSDFPYIGTTTATETAARHRYRQMPAGMMKKQQVFLTDAKRVDPPKPEPKAPEGLPAAEPSPVARVRQAAPVEAPTAFDAMKASLKAGVKVVAVPNLFPTPPDVARRASDLLGVGAGDLLLEPNAGTGALVEEAALRGPIITAVERNVDLCVLLRRKAVPGVNVRCADFLACGEDDLGTFDKVLMNPPFENGVDIKHVEHALGFLKPGGRLVAIVAGGPRQEKAFRDRACHWEELPSGTFAGTGVRSILMAIAV